MVFFKGSQNFTFTLHFIFYKILLKEAHGIVSICNLFDITKDFYRALY